VVNGKWHIDARIGSGGMATVYSATHRNGHRAALKMLHTQLSRDEATRTRFLREGYVANAVKHDGVVHVQDDGVTEDGCAFLVLDLLEGDTIEARRTRFGGTLPIDEALEIADQALDALGAAHDKGIVHRDVKPENVFLCNDGRVKLLDFGLARMKTSQAETTKTGVTIGTPEFMPPEQAQGRRDEVDARSDVWGLGATLFTLITGKYVHDANTLHEQLVASATVRPRAIRDLAPHVPPSLAIVIDRALELEKADRWESAREMQRALRAARGPRSDSDKLVTESLTLPAASLRRGSGPPSGPRSSGRTLETAVPPSSDPTIEEPAPRTEQMILDSLPSSGGPMTPPPRTERLTGTRTSGAVLQAQSQHAQAQHAKLQAALADDASATGPQRSPQAYQRTLASAPRTSAPPGATLASAAHLGSQPPSRASGAPQASSPPPAPAGPASLRQRRSASAIVIVSLLLIVLCASAGAWVLWHP
jgi:serine/threonine-protein kinase